MMRKIWLLALVLLAVAPLQAKTKSTPLPPLVKRAINAVMAGDPAPLKGYMTPEVAQGLTKEVLQAVKQQYVVPLGSLRSASVDGTQNAQGFKVTIFTMHMTKGDLRCSLAENAAGKMAGLHVLPK